MYLRHEDIKIYDTWGWSQSTSDFSTTCSCQYSSICKDSLLTRNLSWRKWWCWNMRSFSRITFLRVPCHGNFWQDPTGLALPDWLLIIDGLQWEDGIVPYNETKRLITTAVFEDNAVVYIKKCEKRGCGTCFWTMSGNACSSKLWMQFTKKWKE